MHVLPVPASLPAALLALLLPPPVADGWLGIFFDVTRAEAVVAEAIAGSPAEKAGLKKGDVLLAVGDKKTPTREDFGAAIRAAKPGEEVTIKLRRGDEELSVAVRLAEPPAKVPSPTEPQPTKPGTRAPAPMTEAPGPTPPAEAQRGYIGVSIAEGDGSVVVERVVDDSPAAAAALRAGDVIVSIDGKAVANRADLDAAMQKTRPGAKVALELRSGENVRSVTLTLGVVPPEVAAPPAKPQPQARASRVPAPAAARPRSRHDADLEAELQALRAELAEVRRLLEELRRGKE